MKIRRAALIVGLAAPVIVAGVVGLAFAGTHVESDDAATPSPKIVDTRDQYELVQEILAARVLPEAEAVVAFDQVRAAWHGRRYRWEVGLVPTLCRSGTNCVAMPFDHMKHPDRQIVQGWLPRIELSDDAHAALVRECESQKQCVFTFEGRLDRFSLDVENPTALVFTDVEIVNVRGATAEESWIRRPRRASAYSGNPNVVGQRTTLSAEHG